MFLRGGDAFNRASEVKAAVTELTVIPSLEEQLQAAGSNNYDLNAIMLKMISATEFDYKTIVLTSPHSFLYAIPSIKPLIIRTLDLMRKLHLDRNPDNVEKFLRKFFFADSVYEVLNRLKSQTKIGQVEFDMVMDKDYRIAELKIVIEMLEVRDSDTCLASDFLKLMKNFDVIAHISREDLHEGAAVLRQHKIKINVDILIVLAQFRANVAPIVLLQQRELLAPDIVALIHESKCLDILIIDLQGTNFLTKSALKLLLPLGGNKAEDIVKALLILPQAGIKINDHVLDQLSKMVGNLDYESDLGSEYDDFPDAEQSYNDDFLLSKSLAILMEHKLVNADNFHEVAKLFEKEEDENIPEYMNKVNVFYFSIKALHKSYKDPGDFTQTVFDFIVNNPIYAKPLAKILIISRACLWGLEASDNYIVSAFQQNKNLIHYSHFIFNAMNILCDMGLLSVSKIQTLLNNPKLSVRLIKEHKKDPVYFKDHLEKIFDSVLESKQAFSNPQKVDAATQTESKKRKLVWSRLFSERIGFDRPTHAAHVRRKSMP